MSTISRTSLLFVFALAISACATLPQIPYDRTAAGNPKTIRVLTPAAPEKASVVLAATVGQSFGLIGALIDAGMQSSRERLREDHDRAQLLRQRGLSAQDDRALESRRL